MTAIQGTNVAAPLAPFDTQDTYPTHDATYGKGGWRSVATIAERDAIPVPRRTKGMCVRVTDDPTLANNAEWEWDGEAWVVDPLRQRVEDLEGRASQAETDINTLDGRMETVEETTSRIDERKVPGIAFDVRDESGNAPFRITDEGIAEFDEVQIGGAAIQREDTVPGVAARIVDEDENTAWDVTDDGEMRIVALDVSGQKIAKRKFPGIAFVMLDADDNAAMVIKNDGTFAAVRLETDDLTVGGIPYSPQLPSPIVSRDTYMSSHGLAPVFPDMLQVSGWGSSSMQYAGARIASMLAEFDSSVVFYNGGVAGERSDTIAGRLGAIPLRATVAGGEIPASGSVAVTVSNALPRAQMADFSGTLNGVAGILSCDGTVFTFTRSVEGAAVTSTGEFEFIPDIGPTMRDGAFLLWMGRNDIDSSISAAETIVNTDTCFDYFRSFVRRGLVIGHHGNTVWSGNASKLTKMQAINEGAKTRYGNQYIDVVSYLQSGQVWSDTGITPTAEDLSLAAEGCIPASLTNDGVHFNTAMNIAFVNVLKSKILELGWYK